MSDNTVPEELMEFAPEQSAGHAPEQALERESEQSAGHDGAQLPERESEQDAGQDGAQAPEPQFYDALFRQKRKHGKYRELELPRRPYVACDTHEHIQLLQSPALSLARARVWNVQFLANVVDIVEDGVDTIEHITTWDKEAEALAADIASGVGVDQVDLMAPEQHLILGVHPHHAKFYTDEIESQLETLCADSRVCAIGEAGLDFYYNHSTPEEQIAMFRRQIRLAHKLKLPLCLHVRDAHDVAFQILEKEGFPEAGCVLHCFNLDAETLKPWIERDVYVGLDGPITFKKSDELREAIKTIPLNRILTETDSPFMTPEPMRGMECGPAHVVYVLHCLEDILGYTDEAAREFFERQLLANAQCLYGSRE